MVHAAAREKIKHDTENRMEEATLQTCAYG